MENIMQIILTKKLLDPSFLTSYDVLVVADSGYSSVLYLSN